MANFDAYVPILTRWEGGWSNHPNDGGGATMRGVTFQTYREYRRKKGLPPPTFNELKNIKEAEWRDIMKTLYWDKIMGDYIDNQSLANFCADWCINSGIGMIRRIQSVLGVETDGIWGRLTLGAMNCNPDKERLFNAIKQNRIAFIYSIVQNNPSQEVFLKGWMNRIHSFKYLSQ